MDGQENGLGSNAPALPNGPIVRDGEPGFELRKNARASGIIIFAWATFASAVIYPQILIALSIVIPISLTVRSTGVRK